ncbi:MULTISPECIES: PilX N-terminal domain-containing pilus assembly protein [Delftia]|uniref:PilX N-terminal domain-containing pilus assembly protein n=1 Tax=Delftia sp. UME58 TaxID=1862322 RepID=UPI001603C23C|nr:MULTISPECIES: PilX N-terminal domain-containing pilus assembly protein [Delftia]MBB1649865.1 pilus assembly protein PilX [Delftia sp. UME58]
MTCDCKSCSRSSRADQRGNALLVSMVMLLLVLLLAVVGMRAVTMEARIAANMLESQRLYETADGTLREGERRLLVHAVALQPCGDAQTPVSSTGIPCFVSDARSDSIALGTDFARTKAKAEGFDKPAGYWYPRYIAATCPKSQSATSALDLPDTGCTAFYEVNAQATEKAQAQPCGADALCLRSSINMFIK